MADSTPTADGDGSSAVRYRCCAIVCRAPVAKPGYCKECKAKWQAEWEGTNKEHRRAYYAARRDGRAAGKKPPCASVEDRWRQRIAGSDALRIETIAAYGGRCVECGVEDELSVVARPKGGGRSERKGVLGDFYRRLRETNWPRIGLLNGRLHAIELYCIRCRRKREYLVRMEGKR